MATQAKPVEPSAKEAFFMLHVLNNQEGNPKINWDNVASAVGLKNGSVASVRFGQIKRRLGWSAPAKGSPSVNSNGARSTAVTSKVTKRLPASKTNGTGAGRGRPKANAKIATTSPTPPTSSPEDANNNEHDDDANEHDLPIPKPEHHETSSVNIDENANFFDTLNEIKSDDAEKFGGTLGRVKAEMHEAEHEAEHGNDDYEFEYNSAEEV